MSGQGEAPEADVTLIEQTGAVPDTVTPANAIDPVPESETPEAPEVEVKEAEPEKPKRKAWWDDRIGELTRQKNEEKREKEALRAENAALKAAKDAAGEPAEGATGALTQAAFDAAVKTEAARLATQQETNKRAQSWLKAGVSEFGAGEFNERCALVVAMGADEHPEFMQIITDPDIIPDGHKVVAMLADHPEDAQRILSLPPIQMAAALARFATQARPEPKAISGAPRPITPIGGSAKASTAPSDDDPIDVWMAKREAHLAAKRSAKTH